VWKRKPTHKNGWLHGFNLFCALIWLIIQYKHPEQTRAYVVKELDFCTKDLCFSSLLPIHSLFAFVSRNLWATYVEQIAAIKANQNLRHLGYNNPLKDCSPCRSSDRAVTGRIDLCCRCWKYDLVNRTELLQLCQSYDSRANSFSVSFCLKKLYF